MQSSVSQRVIEIARDLIRFDTTNYGGGRAAGESAAAAYVTDILDELHIPYEVVIHAADGEPERPSVIARWRGLDPELPALVIHGHLDVVPAQPDAWSVDPFGGVVSDGLLWGRGAVDMKNMVAMILASVEDMMRRGIRPRRDLVLAFFADEEAGGVRGSQFVVRERPDLFAGATEAISEVGGYSVTMSDRRVYLIQTGEKALAWVRLTASGRAGHGSQVNSENAITRLARAIVALGEVEWPVTLTPTTETLMNCVRDITGHQDASPRELASLTGFAARFVEASLQTTANPTVLEAGYKHNVVPDAATALFDVRPLPGETEMVLDEIRRVVGDTVTVSVDFQDIGLETPFSGALVDAMTQSLRRHDPGCEVMPYLLSAGTDNKALHALGIRGFGFVPLRLPAQFDFPGKFHGVDECVPIESVLFGQRVLTDLLTSY